MGVRQQAVLFVILFDATLLLSASGTAPDDQAVKFEGILSSPISAWAQRSAKSVLEVTDLLAARLTKNQRFRRKYADLALTSEQTLDAEAWATAKAEALRLEEGSGAAAPGAAAPPAPAPMEEAAISPSSLDVPRNRAAAKLYASAVAAKLAPPAASAYATQHAAAFVSGSLAPLARSASVEGATQGMRSGMLPNVEQIAHTNTVAGVATIGGPWQSS